MARLPEVLTDLLNEDPDKVIEQLTDEALLKIIDIADNAYFNSSGSGLNDNAYDALRWHAKKRKLRDNLNDVGYLPIDRMRIRLPYFMPSLDKVKADSSLTKFLKSGDTFVWSPKLDGVSAMVVYTNGEISGVYLRGDGITGGNITFMKKYIRAPKRIAEYPNIALRGEMIMSKAEYTGRGTMRNYVSGLLNSTTERQDLAYIYFIAYDIVYLDGDILPSQDEALKLLKRLGFNIVDSGILVNPLASTIVELFLQETEENPFEIDGIVLSRYGERRVPTSLQNPSETVAFKLNLEKIKRKTEVVDVEWNISRNGKYIPVIIYKPVYIEGVRLQRASGSNARRVIDNWQLNRGSKIVVVRSGGVIPQVEEILERGPDDEPIFQPPDTYPWEWKGADIVLTDPDSNEEVLMKRAVYFFEELKIPGIREGMIKRMFDGGLDTLQKIIQASVTELRSIYGIGPVKSNKFYTDIRNRISTAKLYRLMLASNTFGGTSLGKVFLRMISTSIPDFLSYEDDLYPRLVALRGIGPKRAEAFIIGLEKFKDFLVDFQEVEENNREYFAELERTGGNPNIRGNSFVFTNLQDDDLEDYIVDNGGTLVSHVTNNVTAVISGNEADITEKMREAFRNGIPIYTVEEFKERFGIGSMGIGIEVQ